MEYIYISNTIDEQKFNEFFKKNKKIPGQQIQKYHRLIIDGICKNGKKITALSALPITPEISNKRIIKFKSTNLQIKFRYITCINIPIIKNIYVMLVSFLYVFMKCLIYKNVCVICDPLNLSISLGASYATSILNKKCCGIVTDLPDLIVTNINRNNNKIFKKILNNCTCYVFLTEELNTKLNTLNKPYIIIEGHCDITMGTKNNHLIQDNRDKVCLYAGFLDERYGLKKLVDSFIKAGVEDWELHLYGDGPYSYDLKKITETNNKIKYYGVVLNQEIIQLELEADLLVNPRPTNEEFTKYSFPSKNMEYMVSGTPVLTTKLPGMPKEYHEFVYLFEDESVHGMSETLKSVLNLPSNILKARGEKAKNFVLHKKNNVVQSKKIIDLIESQL